MTPRTVLAALTVLALCLRLFHLNNALWLDEIVTLQVYGPMSMWEVVSSYPGSNNHLLNTLLMKICLGLFGDSPAVLRLPAVVFGVAGVPVMYTCARVALSERASLAAAALVAVAYPHIFFSQNARGYTAWLVFSLLGAAWFARGLADDNRRTWTLYVLATVGNFASILLSAFVVLGHGLTGLVGVARLVRRGEDPWPLVRRLVMVYGAAAVGGLLLYVWVIPEVMAYMDAEYRQPGVGYSFFSAAFLEEALRGISSGVGPLLVVALPVGAIVGGLGLWSLFRRNWALTLALFLGLVVQVLAVAALNLSIVPRHFLLAMPLAFLVLVHGVEAVAERLEGRVGRPLASAALAVTVALFTIVSAVQLTGYYAHPKQDFPAALDYLAEIRRPAQRVIALHVTERPIEFYGPSRGFVRGEGTFFVRSVEALDTVLADPQWEPGYLVMTLPRVLDLGLPALSARVRGDWELVKTFPGSLGGGDVTVWKERADPTP
jgi:uncharacterized membrane protein